MSIVAIKKLARHVVEQKQSSPQKCARIPLQNDTNQKQISIGEGDYSTQSLRCELNDVRVVQKKGCDQEARQSEEQTHSHRAGRPIQLKRLRPKRDHMGRKNEQNADRP